MRAAFRTSLATLRRASTEQNTRQSGEVNDRIGPMGGWRRVGVLNRAALRLGQNPDNPTRVFSVLRFPGGGHPLNRDAQSM
ncbi:hypothetical protein MESS2_280045 [Mesorhizobium metallidurans STM 2683]|uniref:Uncharacterized protein n=1 Tax=Mesorhizobium metallidurans STM 2683 TaxID=1297569 RepID=M5EPV0_9HYPH|nr:hypothetical protein MESS2_280045 [Mesorhizobium metallidurans STM 2683]